MLMTVGADGRETERTCRFAYGSTAGDGHARRLDHREGLIWVSHSVGTVC